jgi:hypothetical protein
MKNKIFYFPPIKMLNFSTVVLVFFVSFFVFQFFSWNLTEKYLKIQIKAKPAEIWQFLTELENQKKWEEGLKEIKILNGGNSIRKGDSLQYKYEHDGTIFEFEKECKRFLKNEILEFSVKGIMGYHQNQTWVLVSMNNGTTTDLYFYTDEEYSNFILNSLKFLLRIIENRRLSRNLEKLKNLNEI